MCISFLCMNRIEMFMFFSFSFSIHSLFRISHKSPGINIEIPFIFNTFTPHSRNQTVQDTQCTGFILTLIPKKNVSLPIQYILIKSHIFTTALQFTFSVNFKQQQSAQCGKSMPQWDRHECKCFIYFVGNMGRALQLSLQAKSVGQQTTFVRQQFV